MTTYITTVSGIDFDLINPRESQVRLVDIAHAIAQINRYTGHSPYPYSVAQHSVMCAHVAPPGFELEALLHDAHEAYTNDVSSPLKSLCPGYRAAEDKIAAVVRRRFGVPVDMSPEVHAVDRRMLVTEARHLGFHWAERSGAETYIDGVDLSPWSWERARAAFLTRAEMLGCRE